MNEFATYMQPTIMSVYLSGGAFEQVRGKTGFAFDDLGEKSLKNIDRPVRLYAVRPGGAMAATSAKPAFGTDAPLTLPDKPSISDIDESARDHGALRETRLRAASVATAVSYALRWSALPA